MTWRSRGEGAGAYPGDNSTNRRAKHAGSSASSQKAAFSFLMPLDDDNTDRRLSDSESAASFSELSLSAASIATAGLREESDWRRDELGWQEGDTPGPWLKPSPQKLTQVLTGSRLRGRELVGGLSLWLASSEDILLFYSLIFFFSTGYLTRAFLIGLLEKTRLLLCPAGWPQTIMFLTGRWEANRERFLIGWWVNFKASVT